jgi:hypothetical protein
MKAKQLAAMMAGRSVTLSASKYRKGVAQRDPSREEVARAQAQAREIQQSGAEIDCRVKALQAIITAQNAELEREAAERLENHKIEILLEAAEVLGRIARNQQREQELAARRRKYNRERKKKLSNGK